MDEQAARLHGQRLLQAGISRKVVKRYLKELEAHYSDLLVQARYQGLADSEAQAWTTQRLGSEEHLLASMLDRPELRSWTHRHPGSRRCYCRRSSTSSASSPCCCLG